MFNLIDLIILLFLGLYAFHGWRRGFLLLTLDFVGFLFVITAPLILHRYGAAILEHFGVNLGIANGIAFFVILGVTQMLFWLLSRVLYKLVPKEIRNSIINRMLGMIPSLAKGYLLCSLILMLIVVLPTKISDQMVLNSAIGGPMVRLASAVERAATSMISKSIQDSLTFLSVKPKSDETLKIPQQTQGLVINGKAETQMLKMVNRERATRGLKPLKMNAKLQAAARKHSLDMFKRGFFGHINPDKLTPFDRMQKAGILYTKAGENLAKAPSVSIAHDGLMHSPGHRANILDPGFRQIGIGVYSSSIYGEIYSQEFTD